MLYFLQNFVYYILRNSYTFYEIIIRIPLHES